MTHAPFSIADPRKQIPFRLVCDDPLGQMAKLPPRTKRG